MLRCRCVNTSELGIRMGVLAGAERRQHPSTFRPLGGGGYLSFFSSSPIDALYRYDVWTLDVWSLRTRGRVGTPMEGSEEFYLDDGTCALYMCPLPPSLPCAL